MTSGLDWTEPLTEAPPETMLQMARSSDWVGFVLDRRMAQAPGAAFNYNSGDWQLMSAILTKKTGLDTFDYARRTLFGPLGITDATWLADPQGIRAGGYGLSLLPRDSAKIGYLYLHRGEWAGQRLLARGVGRSRLPRDRRHEARRLAARSLRQRLVVDRRQARADGGRLPAPADHRPARGRHGRRRHRQAPLSDRAAHRSARRRGAFGDAAAGRRRRHGAPGRARARRRGRAGDAGRPGVAAGGEHLGQRSGASSRTPSARAR